MKTEITKQTIIDWCKKYSFHVAPSQLTIEGRDVFIDNGKVYASSMPGYREIKTEELFVSFFEPIKQKRLGVMDYDPNTNSMGIPIICYDKYTNKVIGDYPSIRRASAVHDIPQTNISRAIAKNEPIGDIYFQHKK